MAWFHWSQQITQVFICYLLLFWFKAGGGNSLEFVDPQHSLLKTKVVPVLAIMVSFLHDLLSWSTRLLVQSQPSFEQRNFRCCRHADTQHVDSGLSSIMKFLKAEVSPGTSLLCLEDHAHPTDNLRVGNLCCNKTCVGHARCLSSKTSYLVCNMHVFK